MTADLSPRQREALAAINCGADTEQVAEELGVSYWVAHKHIKTLRKKLGVVSLVDLPEAARQQGVDLPACEE